MELVLNVPMLANHRYEDRRRPYEACNIDAIVTGDGSTRVSGPDRFDDNHRPEVWPFCQRRQSRQIGHRPDPPPDCAAVRIIEGIKEVLGRTPTVCLDVISLVVSSCGYNRGEIAQRVAQ